MASLQRAGAIETGVVASQYKDADSKAIEIWKLTDNPKAQLKIHDTAVLGNRTPVAAYIPIERTTSSVQSSDALIRPNAYSAFRPAGHADYFVPERVPGIHGKEVRYTAEFSLGAKIGSPSQHIIVCVKETVHKEEKLSWIYMNIHVVHVVQAI